MVKGHRDLCGLKPGYFHKTCLNIVSIALLSGCVVGWGRKGWPKRTWEGAWGQ